MTKRELLSMALKVLGIWFAVLQCKYFVGAASLLLTWELEGHAGEWAMVAVYFDFAGELLLVALGVCVARWSDWIARRAMPAGEEPVTWTELKIGSETVLLLAMKCLGLVVLLDAADMLLQGLASSLQAGVGWVRYLFFGAGFDLVVGAYLFMGGRAVAHWLAKGSSDSTPAVLGQNAWEKPFFVQALRVVGMVLLVWRLPWIVTVTVLKWLPPPIGRLMNDYGWSDVARSAIIVGVSLYLIFGARHLVDWVFCDEKAHVARG